MIDREHQLPLTRQSEILQLSRSSLYYKAVPVSPRDLEIMKLIDEIHLKYPFYGSRSIRDELRDQGYKIGREHVRTLMKKMGIEALYRKTTAVEAASWAQDLSIFTQRSGNHEGQPGLGH